MLKLHMQMGGATIPGLYVGGLSGALVGAEVGTAVLPVIGPFLEQVLA